MNIKSIAFSGLAVVVAVVMSLGLMASPAKAAAIADATGTASQVAWEAGAAGTTGAQTFTMPGNIVITEGATAWAAADTIALTHTGVTSSTVTTTGPCTAAGAANTLTITLTAAVTAGTDTCTLNTVVLKITADEAAGTVHNITLPNATIVGTVTSRALVLGWTASSACGNPILRTTPSTSADPSASGIGLCGVASTSAGVANAALPITFTSSVGVVSTGTAKTVNSLTSAAGLATTTYRGSGNNVTTDTLIASNTSINTVSTLSVSLTAPSGNTASKVIVNAPTTLAVAATVSNTTPNYQSPTFGTNFSVQVQDSAGLGVNGQVVLVSTDRGAIAAGFNATCTGTTARSITGTSASGAPTVGGTAVSGVIQATYCANQLDAPGKATITAQNVSTTMANATQSLSMAGRPDKVEATATGNAIAVKVTDAGGNAVADGTPVRFTIGGANAGNVSTTCTTTSNGAASAVAALAVPSATVLVSVDWNETGSVPGCAAAGAGTFTPAIVSGTGAQQRTASVTVPGGSASSGGTTTPSTPAAGTVSSGSVPAAGGFGFFVYGGPVSGLAAATGCPAGTAAFWATVNGEFVTNVPGTTISAVNAAFNAAFPNGIPAGTALLGKCK